MMLMARTIAKAMMKAPREKTIPSPTFWFGVIVVDHTIRSAKAMTVIVRRYKVHRVRHTHQVAQDIHGGAVADGNDRPLLVNGFRAFG